MGNKKKINKGLIILIIIFIIFVLSSVMYFWIQDLPEGSAPREPYFSKIVSNITETEDYLIIEIIDYIDKNNEDDIKYFIYHLRIVDDNVDIIYENRQDFVDLKYNKSKYIEFIDKDNNDRITNNDVIQIQKCFNLTNYYVVYFDIHHFSPKEGLRGPTFKLQRKIEI